jgi:hypothetical protein
VRRGPAADRSFSSTTWQPRQPTDSTIALPDAAFPCGAEAERGANSSEFAKRYATVASISASFRGASCGEFELELYQTCGIQVAGLIARGSRIQFFTHSGDSFDLTRVRFGPGFLNPSNPRVLWHA